MKFFITMLVLMMLSHQVNASPITGDVIYTVTDCANDIDQLMDGFMKEVRIVPNDVIDNAINPVKKQAGKAKKAVEDFKNLCEAVKNKDGITAYFYILDKLTSKDPAAAYYSYQINAGRKIVERAREIAESIGYIKLFGDNGVETDITIRLTKSKRGLTNWFPDSYSAKEIISKISSIEMVAKLNDNTELASSNFLGCADDLCNNDWHKILRVNVGEALSSWDMGKIKNLYIKVIWKNGQMSLVPVKSGYVEAISNGFNLPFAYNQGWYEYVY